MACGETPTARPAPPLATTPTEQPASAADLALISQTFTATASLTSYHIVLTGSGAPFTAPLALEGDFVAPNKAYMKGTVGGRPFEELVDGHEPGYVKDTRGNWAVRSGPESGTAAAPNPVDVCCSDGHFFVAATRRGRDLPGVPTPAPGLILPPAPAGSPPL